MGFKYRRACFGGTFDIPIHRGHEALIKRAFEVAEFCYIGLTTDRYVLRMGKRDVSSFSDRERNLVEFLTSKKVQKSRYKIVKLDKFFADEVLDPKTGIEAIIVSRETLPGARGINILREDYGLKPLDIVEIGMVLADDKKPVSSTRIREGEIDKDGNVLED